MVGHEIVITGDGSHTLKLRGTDEHFHSTFGALTESRHVFINAGLRELLGRGVAGPVILEVGFGTGLNALLTMLDLDGKKLDTRYFGLEAHPLDEACRKKLNYPEMLPGSGAGEYFDRLHRCTWGEPHEIAPGFTLHKVHASLQDYRHHAPLFNLVYFDAFSPLVQPELWTSGIFLKVSDMMAVGGILVTYSSKGSVKRALKASGFEVEKIPGPPGKREMLRGVKR